MRQTILGIEFEGYQNSVVFKGDGWKGHETKREEGRDLKKGEKWNKKIEISPSYGSSLKLIMSFD